ncbi:MAG: PAS domain S-box protein [Longimicrobiales bacterium]|nr:PAS domain S-box protein [Longimicrobiales bacterium]
MNRAFRVGLIYLVVSFVWIVATDALVLYLDLEPALVGRVQTLKGMVFVALSGLLVTLLAWRELRSFQEAERYFQASPDLFAILDLDRRVARLNNRWREVLGTSDQPARPDWFMGMVHPDDRELVQDALERAEAGEALRRVPCRLWGVDGDWRAFEWNLVPEGRRIYAAGRDISDREALRDELVQSEERYRQIFEASPLPTFVFDQETLRFLAVNDAAVEHYGWSRTAFLEKTVLDIRPEEDRERVLEVIRATPDSTFHHAGVWRHRTRDGRTLLVEVNAHRVTFLGRGAQLVVANDVTSRLHAEDQLRQAQRMESVGRLAGGIAHDFNNLLTIIGNLTTLAGEELPHGSPARQLLDEVLSAQRRGAELTRQLLTFSRQEPMKSPVVVDLRAALTEMAALFRPLLGGEVRVHMELGAAPAAVKIAPIHLEQVIMNLVVNARDAMPTGGELFLTLAVAAPGPRGAPGVDGAGQAILTVRDTGAGVPAEVVPHLFDPFFTTKPPHQGTGLGLSTAYGIVTQAGGTLRLASPPGARGATFEVRLPLSAEAATHPPVGAEPRAAAAGGPVAGGRVLLVEDEAALQRALRLGLSRQGFEVETASDGAEALRLYGSMTPPPDILVTDMILPGMNGQELVETLRASRPNLPVLVISGYAGDRAEVDAFLAREHFLPKPFTLETLGEKVRKILRPEV